VDGVDPKNSIVRKTWRPKVPNLREHQPFIELLQRELTSGSVIWDIGLGSTEIHRRLREIGFQVFAIVDEKTNLANKSGVNVTKCNLLTEQRNTLVRDGLPKADACIFCCNLQRFSTQEIRVLLVKALSFSGEHGTTSGKVFFNVPSVYYPHFYDKDSLLMRETWWRRTLKRFIYRLKPYGAGKRFFMFTVNTIDGEPIGDRTYEYHVRFFRRMYRFEGRIHEIINAANSHVKQAPRMALIEHFKSAARQERQNAFYEEWKE